MSRRHYLPGFAALAVLVSTIALALPKAPAQAEQEPPAVVRVGYGAADATWHVGAGSGQYTSKKGVPEDPEDPESWEQSVEETLDPDQSVDPHGHSTTQKKSYGVQSRLSYRAIVVEDAEGDHVAFVKSDSYLAQDYLTRRVGQILEAHPTSKISYDEIMLMASHNHSSPYYTTPSWGVWLFQDAFDLRAFEYHARQMASAILTAEEDLQDAEMGATTITHDAFKGVIQRAGIAEDGSPRGYPRDGGDLGLVVVRFDSLETGQPIASLLNWGQHPEGLDSHDLITGDFVAPLERFVERATGAPVVFGQGDVGSAEAGPGQPNKVPDGMPKRWSHAGHAQGERGAFLLAQDAIKAWNLIGQGDAQVPFDSTFDVAAGNAFVPGPLSHPYPSVSNCRTHTTAEGNPGAPVAGLPDCARARDGDDNGNPLNPLFESLKSHGIPVPEHYDAPAFTGVEENLRLKLQAFKIGDVILASCACEAQWDLIANLESRLDNVPGNIWDGFDWTEDGPWGPKDLECTESSGTWTCNGPHFNNLQFSDAAYKRMKAHIHNDAAGWNDPDYVPFAGTEPANPADIKGNFTKDELAAEIDGEPYKGVPGYTLPVGVGHASDYNGYTVSYREYMSWDDYRKALTSYGPHTADYMNTWLVALGAFLNGGPALPPAINDAAAQADEARQLAVSQALGAASEAAYDAWMAALPNDFGTAGVLPDEQGQPSDIQKFEAATFSWRGGSNVADNPTVTVQRLDGLDQEGNPNWVDFADQTGEVQTKVDFPNGADAIIDTYSGNQEWIWTANFEAFDAYPLEIGSTPPGTYRFFVEGRIRTGNAFSDYDVTSDEFEVAPWDGIGVSNFKTDESGDVTFELPELYPSSYESVFPYVGDGMMNDDQGKPFCSQCSFRPWATRIDYTEVLVTVTRADGTIEKIAAVFVPAVKDQQGNVIDPAYWTAATALEAGDQVKIEAGDVSDVYGERNTASVSI